MEVYLRETVSRALDHMLLTFDETEVFVDAMRIIEDEYKCNRIVNAHEFMAHAEYYGGDINESARILLKDKSAWERRILHNIEDRQRMFHQIILSVVTSVIYSLSSRVSPAFDAFSKQVCATELS